MPVTVPFRIMGPQDCLNDTGDNLKAWFARQDLLIQHGLSKVVAEETPLLSTGSSPRTCLFDAAFPCVSHVTCMNAMTSQVDSSQLD